MLIQLKNGRTIEINTEYYYRLSDDEYLRYIDAISNFSQEVNDPFSMSVLVYGSSDEDADEELNYLDEEEINDLLDIDAEEKIYDQDFYNKEELEV